MRETPLTQRLFPGQVYERVVAIIHCVSHRHMVGVGEVNGEENVNQEWSKLKHCLFDEFHMF